VLRHRTLLSCERLVAVLALALVLFLGLTAGRARADEAGRQMQLEVVLNGNPTQLIGAFVMLDDGRIAARRQELEEIGIAPRGYASPDKLVILDDLFGLSYRYEESTQRISITAPEELLVTKEYNISRRAEAPELAKTDYGAVLNYTLFASGGSSPISGRSRSAAPRQASMAAFSRHTARSASRPSCVRHWMNASRR